jgi:hypothetical protein
MNQEKIEDTVPTQEMLENLTDFMVNAMSYEELKQFVYDDIYNVMLNDEEMFYVNLPVGLEPEDFTNEKFRGES